MLLQSCSTVIVMERERVTSKNEGICETKLIVNAMKSEVVVMEPEDLDCKLVEEIDDETQKVLNAVLTCNFQQEFRVRSV